MLGEHTDQVLSEWLGLTAQAVAEMKREGVIGSANRETPG
jgi:crotonobetainyl-CoA:carnitine CoA-transferase CaiB-like acyl-CoA transferase